MKKGGDENKKKKKEKLKKSGTQNNSLGITQEMKAIMKEIKDERGTK